MKYRTLGNELEVSAVGLGCMGFTHAYGQYRLGNIQGGIFMWKRKEKDEQ